MLLLLAKMPRVTLIYSKEKVTIGSKLDTNYLTKTRIICHTFDEQK